MAMKIKVGSFSGTGSAQSITGVGFAPELVMLKSDSATVGSRLCFRSSSITGDKTLTCGGALTAYTGGITSLDADGFTVGTDVSANENGKTIHYLAVYDNDDSQFSVGTYTGDGNDNRQITSLSFQPDFLLIKSEGADRMRFRVSSVAGDSTLCSENSANVTNTIQQFLSNGFELGTSANVNNNATVYHWIAFKSVSSAFAVGTYTGDGNDNRDYASIGFQSDFIMIKGDTAQNGALRSSVLSGDLSWNQFGSNASGANVIQDISSNGMQLGTDATVNGNGVSYYFAAWKTISGATSTGTSVFGDECLVY